MIFYQGEQNNLIVFDTSFKNKILIIKKVRIQHFMFVTEEPVFCNN